MEVKLISVSLFFSGICCMMPTEALYLDSKLHIRFIFCVGSPMNASSHYICSECDLHADACEHTKVLFAYMCVCTYILSFCMLILCLDIAIVQYVAGIMNVL